MGGMVLGHAGTDRGRVWLQASAPARWASLRVDGRPLPPLRLDPEDGTVTATLDALTHARPVQIAASFHRERGAADAAGRDPASTRSPVLVGELRAFPARGRRARFVLASCHLPPIWPALSRARGHRRGLAEVVRAEGVDFMLHAGDGIYFDVPWPWHRPTVEAYRARYLRAYGHDPALAEVLRSIPHYMTLDDHELIDDFSNDTRSWYRSRPNADYREPGLRAYRAMVHARQPHSHGEAPLYYSFAHGDLQFFVLDTRSERWRVGGGGPGPRMISEHQRWALQRWLLEHRHATKFVLTSVPFVFRTAGSVDLRDDKWNGPAYQGQRDALLRFLLEQRVGRLCFLTGDMHAAGAARLELAGVGARLELPELMSSPLRQVEHGRRGGFEGRHRWRRGGVQGNYELDEGAFLGGRDNAMLVEVNDDTLRWELFCPRTGARGLRRGELRLGPAR